MPTKLFQKVLTLGEHMDGFSAEMSLTLTILTWLWALAWFEGICCFYPKSCKWIWCPLWSGSFESSCLVGNKRLTLGVLWSPDLNSFSVPDLNPSNFPQLSCCQFHPFIHLKCLSHLYSFFFLLHPPSNSPGNLIAYTLKNICSILSLLSTINSLSHHHLLTRLLKRSTK